MCVVGCFALMKIEGDMELVLYQLGRLHWVLDIEGYPQRTLL